MKDLSLSLSPVLVDKRPSELKDLDIRSAFVSIDLNAELSEETLSLMISKLHAVMSPSSLGELGDLIDYVQVSISWVQWQYPKKC